MTQCPKCGHDAHHAVWPFLKGTLEHGEPLVWHRCTHCQALFSDLTRPADELPKLPTADVPDDSQLRH